MGLKVIDNDVDEVRVELNGKELRGWSYKGWDERNTKMLCAREYVEGYYDGMLAGHDRASETAQRVLREITEG